MNMNATGGLKGGIMKAKSIEVECAKCGQLQQADLSMSQINQGWECANCGAVSHGQYPECDEVRFARLNPECA